jgi:uncharacterized membrane protein
MIGALVGFAIKAFGPTALKAVVGGVVAGGSVVATTAAGACDWNSIGSQIGAALGAYAIGHIATWIVPNKKA